jgi:NTE family protein
MTRENIVERQLYFRKQMVKHIRLYWLKRKGFKEAVPRLNIGIVNVHRLKQDKIPWDLDGVVNRSSDITFSDRTMREQEALLLVSDYVDLARELIKVAKSHGVKDDVINNLLNRKTINHGLAFRPRTYSDILVGQYDIGNVIRINRKNDE